MCRILITTLAAALATAPAGGQTPATAPAVTLSPDAIARRAFDLARVLPPAMKAPDTGQRARADEGCDLFRRALPRIDELDQDGQATLAQLGVQAGSAAGDAKTMLAGAKALWARADRTRPADYEAASLAQAAVLAGDPAVGKEALGHLVAHPSQPAVAEWAKLQKPVVEACGKPVAARIKLISGGVLDFAKQRGKVIVLDFWSSECPPYIQVLPKVKEFHRARAGNPLLVHVGISLDRKADETAKAAAENGIDWPQALDAGLRERFAAQGIPHTVVLSADGRPIWQGHPIQVEQFAETVDFALRQAARPDQARNAQATSAPDPDETAQKAEAAYQLARAYVAAGMSDKARPLLEKLIEEYPGTPAAAKAQADLARMK